MLDVLRTHTGEHHAMEDVKDPIELVFEGYGYRWKGANVPEALRGMWTDPIAAKSVAQSYLIGYHKRKERKAQLVNPERTPLEDLNVLTRKAELLEFAVKHNIEVGADKKNPSQIKAYIKKVLEKRDG